MQLIIRDLIYRSPLVLKGIIGKKLLELNNGVLLSSHVSMRPYTLKDYYNDLYTGIWGPTIQGRHLTDGDKLLQRMLVQNAVNSVGKIVGKKSGKSLQDQILAYAPSVDELALYGLDPMGYVEEFLPALRALEEERGQGYVASWLSRYKQFGDKGDYGWQSEIKTSQIDESGAYYADMLEKIERLIKAKILSANAADKIHYRSILLIIDSLKKG
ncbi:hypothetical protein [Butyricimonas faecalis]|uniref:hypothetical protein n=1 Tax=Butyricimonas faecalis TaxID=2093856 RepID=UPI000D0ADE4A|nr:hypothetical protein [Butyricimonas faecalis]